MLKDVLFCVFDAYVCLLTLQLFRNLEDIGGITGIEKDAFKNVYVENL